MRTASFATSVALLLASSAITCHAQSEPYMYVIYYNAADCGEQTVNIAGHSHDEQEIVRGGNDTDAGLCSLESTCLVDRDSQFCLEDLSRTVIADTRNQIGNDGKIFQCDDTNEDVDQPTCRFLDQCYASSVYPHCHFQLRTTNDLIRNVEPIRNEKGVQYEGMDQTSYLLLYSDSECQDLEGAQGIVAPNATFGMTSPDMSCRDAVACAFSLDGSVCESNGGIVGTRQIVTRPSFDATVVCDENDENCVTHDPAVCSRSELYPSCYHRLVTSTELFSNPEKYFTSTLIALKDPVGDGSSDVDTNTDTDTDSKTEESESASSKMIGFSLNFLFLLVVIIDFSV